MKFIPSLLVILFWILSFGVHAQETIPYFDTVPIHRQFEILEDSLIMFDKPEGQIVEISLVCQANCPLKSSIQKYYDDVLGQLEWKRVGNIYRKNGQSVMTEIAAPMETGSPMLITLRKETK